MNINKGRRYNLGLFFVVALVAIAFFLWAISPVAVARFGGLISSLKTLGQIFGIIGMVLFAVSLILSARFAFLEKLFYGLDKIYVRHSQIGQIAFMLILFHPLLLLGAYDGYSFGGALSFFIPRNNWAFNWGIIGLALMLLLIALTLYIRPRYNIWKWTHKLMGLAFFFGIIHAYMIPSDIHTFLPLRIYILSISAVALYAYLYHTVFGFYTTKKYKYVVSNLKILGRGIVEVSLLPKTDKIIFTPGQFVFISFDDAAVSKESHPFSISSSPNDEHISFTIKNLGDYTKNIKNLKIGAEATIEGPFGKFSYKESIHKKQIWIAGGIGITPFLSMAKSLKNNNDYSVDLYYCARSPDEAFHMEDLAPLQSSGVRVIPHYSSESGRINTEIIKKYSNSIINKSIFICSPVGMIESLRKQFLANGVPSYAIYSEEFDL